MGLGYWTCEKLYYSDTGAILTDRTWDYHLPEARDIPQDFRVYFKRNSYSNELILGSKGKGKIGIIYFGKLFLFICMYSILYSSTLFLAHHYV